MDVAELILSYIKVLIWPTLLIIVLTCYRRQVGDLITRTRSLDTPAGTIEFVEHAGELLDEAAKEKSISLTASDRHGVMRRLEHAAKILEGGKILWVDDHPRGNLSLISLFRTSGMEVDTVKSSKDALEKLRVMSYDILLTDLQRGSDSNAGNFLLQELVRLDLKVPAVVYSRTSRIVQGVDPRAFAVTASPDEVVHYVIDLMERIVFS
ncbi:response regulator [Actinomadura chokoriensis]|uniref:Response regulator n=1 Tax=Actinomadura chokoriensis TaxID=454156 RepID=A0ABV4R4M9_9ACTN